MPLNFVCPECQCNQLEEVVTNCTVYQIVELVDNGDYDQVYGRQVSEGDVNRYQCHLNGHVIKNEAGEPITDIEELCEWLKTLPCNKKKEDG